VGHSVQQDACQQRDDQGVKCLNGHTNLIGALYSPKIRQQRKERDSRSTYHNHPHRKCSQLLYIMQGKAAPFAGTETNQRTIGFPYFPACSTSPRPRSATHALSRPFGSAYIANSPRRCLASTNNDKPVIKPPIQCIGRDITAASSHAGTSARRADNARCAFCIAQNQPWNMTTATERNAVLRAVPQAARIATCAGACTNAARLKSRRGTKCSAP
jgi:hypothetical protein